MTQGVAQLAASSCVAWETVSRDTVAIVVTPGNRAGAVPPGVKFSAGPVPAASGSEVRRIFPSAICDDTDRASLRGAPRACTAGLPTYASPTWVRPRHSGNADALLAPFPDVTVPIVNPRPVRTVGADLGRSPQVDPLAGLAVRVGAVEVGLDREEVV